jgi:PEP-CTERM motif
MIALNEFTVTGGNNLITSISIASGGPGDASPNGLLYTAVLWSDPLGTGVPGIPPPTVLGSIPNQVISGSGTNTFLTSTFSSPIAVLTQNFYVGFIVTHFPGQSPGAADTSLLFSNRSFVAFSAGSTGNIYDLNQNDIPVGSFDGTWMIRANAVPEPSVYMLLGIGLLFCCQRFLRHPAA